MPQHICVYCSSSNAIASSYFEAAADLGRRMAARGDTLVYGGSSIGLMGEVARSVHDAGGRVVGIIPQMLWDLEVGNSSADELIITSSMRERKALMEARADAFLALPGGLGTLEELAEILTLKQLELIRKPLVLLNTGGFYDPLVDLFDHMSRANFVRADYQTLYHLAPTLDDVFDYIDRNVQTAPKIDGGA